MHVKPMLISDRMGGNIFFEVDAQQRAGGDYLQPSIFNKKLKGGSCPRTGLGASNIRIPRVIEDRLFHRGKVVV